MKYRLSYVIINSILLALFFFTSVIYFFSATYPFLVAILFFSFNPTLLILGVGLIILGNFYRVSLVNRLLPFIGIVGINIPGVVAGSIFPALDSETALVYSGSIFGFALFIITAIVVYSGLKIKES